RRTSRRSSSTPCATASPVSSWRTRVGSLVRTRTSSPSRRYRISTSSSAVVSSRGVPMRMMRPSRITASRGRVEARRRLVEEHEVGVADERDAEVEAPLLTARERLDPRVALLVEADERDHLVDVPGLGVVAGEHRVRLVDREARPQLRVLQHDADPLAELRAGPLRVVPQHAHVAGVPVAVALEDLDRRRLPGAVRPEQAEHLALVDLEVDAAYRLVLAVRLPQAADLDRVHRSRRVCAQGGNAGSGRPPRVATARLQSGWWPTTTTHSPCSAATARMSSGVAPGASRSSTCGSPRPSAAAVSRARSSGLETTASAANPSARSWAPTRRACSCPAAVSVRVSSGVPGAASACRTIRTRIGGQDNPAMASYGGPAAAAGTFAITAALACDGGGFDQVTWTRMLVVVAGCALAAVFLLGSVQVGRDGAVAVGGLTALTAWTAASWLWSESPPRALVEAQRVALYAAVVLLVAAVRPPVRWVAAGVACACAFVAVWNLVTRVRGVDDPGTTGAQAAPVGYANSLGLVCVVGLVLLPMLPRIGLVLLVPLAVDLALQRSSGAIAALAAGLLAFAFVGYPRARRAVVVL